MVDDTKQHPVRKGVRDYGVRITVRSKENRQEKDSSEENGEEKIKVCEAGESQARLFIYFPPSF